MTENAVALVSVALLGCMVFIVVVLYLAVWVMRRRPNRWGEANHVVGIGAVDRGDSPDGGEYLAADTAGEVA